jgi:hypothetical protein
MNFQFRHPAQSNTSGFLTGAMIFHDVSAETRMNGSDFPTRCLFSLPLFSHHRSNLFLLLPYNFAFSIFIAWLCFYAGERSFWHCTTIPVEYA